MEKNVKCINFDENENLNLSRSNSTIEFKNEEKIDNKSDLNDSFCESVEKCDKSENKTETKSPRRSTRMRKITVRYPNKDPALQNQFTDNSKNYSTHNVFVQYCRINTPCKFEEVKNCNESKNWEKVMNQEIDSINKNKTWKLVEKVKEKKVLDVKWIYTRKLDDRFKARLVI